jgi:putative ABC transport system permease protein
MTGYDAARAGRFLEDGVQRLRALPQVEAVALTSRLPLSLNNNGFSVYIDGQQLPASGRAPSIDGAYVDERYFDALELRLLAGRNIQPADRDENRRIAVISQAMAQRYWPGRPENAIGRGFRFRDGGDLIQVVGVVGDYKVDTPGEAPKSYYTPASRTP